MRAFLGTMVMGSAAILLFTSSMAEAVELRARCDYRAGRGERTKVSVDLKDLARGSYTATINDTYYASGAVTPPSDEIEFDFDSNPANIAKGATAIPAHLGDGGWVSVDVSGPAGNIFTDLPVPCSGEVRIP